MNGSIITVYNLPRATNESHSQFLMVNGRKLKQILANILYAKVTSNFLLHMIVLFSGSINSIRSLANCPQETKLVFARKEKTGH